MPYRFLRYLQPAYYFSLARKDGTFIYPMISEVETAILNQVPENQVFSSDLAKSYARSWRLVQSGYVGTARRYTSFEKLPVTDEYIFVSMWFNKIWVLYIFLIRIATFCNPIVEVKGLRKSWKIKSKDYKIKPLNTGNWSSFQSNLVESNPLVSIVIPTLNRYEYLEVVLDDLYKQKFQNFEIIIFDQSSPFQETFYKDYDSRLKVVYQEEKALWLARNSAVEMANGSYFLLFDDDSRVDENWIENHLKCLDFFKADISSGVSISKNEEKVPNHYSFFKVSSQLDTGNVMIKKEVFESVGLFDRQFEKQRMGDGEFGLRCFLEGFRNISNPYSKRLHLKVGTGGLRQMGSWDAFRTKRWFAPRPIPSVLYFYRRYFGKKRAILALLKSVPPSIIPYRFKRNKVLLLLGIFISVLLLPLIAIQVIISWRKATKKINEGPLIRAFN